MRILLEAEADPTLSNNEGLTPLDVAREATMPSFDITYKYSTLKYHDIVSRARRNKIAIIDALETVIDEVEKFIEETHAAY